MAKRTFADIGTLDECEYCGTEIRIVRPNQLYCSRLCKHRAWRLRESEKQHAQ